MPKIPDFEINGEIHRTCKTCNFVGPLTSFDKSYNKNCKTQCYRYDCSPCLRSKRKEYLQNYHKQKYVKKETRKKYTRKVHHCDGCNCNKNI